MKAKPKTGILFVTITDRGRFYVNEKRVSKTNLESRLISSLGNGNTPSIVLRAEQKVAIQEVVYVMNLANKNGIKVVLAVDTP